MNELKALHYDLKSIKLIYRVSRDGYDATKLTNMAIDYEYTFSVIKTNHGRTFGFYTPIKWIINKSTSAYYQKMHDGQRSFAYFFDNQKLRMCRPR